MPPSTLSEAEESRVRAQLGWISDQMDGIVKAADGRDLTKAQASDFDKHHKESRRLLGLIGERPSLFEMPEGAKAAEEVARSLNAWARAPMGARMGEPRGGRPEPTGSMGAVERRTGDVLVLGREERMAGHVPAGAPGTGLRMGQLVRAIVTGDWSGIDPEARAMSVGTATAGGYLVPGPLSANVIDKARNIARVFQAGAQTVVMDSSTLKIARVATDPTAAWKLENELLAPSDMALEVVTLTAHTLMALVKGSVELFEDAQGIGDTIDNALAAALAAELDRVALRGTGTAPEPRGILNTSGVTTTGSVGSPTYADLSLAVQDVREANGEPNAYILSPRDAGTLDRLVDTTGQPLRPPPSVEGMRQYATAQIPTNLGVGTNESEIYVGQWDELLVGMRTTLTIEASREAADADGSAFRALQVWVRAYLRADIAVAHPNHFSVLTGVL